MAFKLKPFFRIAPNSPFQDEPKYDKRLDKWFRGDDSFNISKIDRKIQGLTDSVLVRKMHRSSMSPEQF